MRIAKKLPDVKIVYIVRHPLRRMESCFRQALSTGHWQTDFYSYTKRPMPLKFNKAVRTYPHFLGTTRYWYQLSEYREYFPDQQILLIFFEDFIADPRKEIARCFQFLGVDADYQIEDAESPKNVGASKKMDRPILAQMRRLKIFKNVTSLIPARLKRVIHGSFFQTAVPVKLTWEPGIKKWVLEQLHGEIRSILKYGGKLTNFWDFS